ncbi:MAG: DNA-directed RNA polymerase subunit beta [Proteobacteria bacterium]|nr:DNA-directed RNA polymerase subunit beta [Pseudomonadota bacterium]
MAKPATPTTPLRRDFSRLPSIIVMPNLIEVQKESYEKFLQMKVDPERREETGLHAVFKGIFPIEDYSRTTLLDYVKYDILEPKFDVQECQDRGMTFAAPLNVTIRLIHLEVDEETKTKKVKEVKEQDVYLGEIPLMTANGTFIINGTERVIVSQLHRSPGVFYELDKSKSMIGGRPLYSARVIPYRGSWLDFEYDAKGLINVRIDRRRKIPATILLKALGYNPEQIIRMFYPIDLVRMKGDKALKAYKRETLEMQNVSRDILDPATGEVLVREGRKVFASTAKKIEQAGVKEFEIDPRLDLIGHYLASQVVDMSTGEVIGDCNSEITEEFLEKAKGAGIDQLEVIFIDPNRFESSLRDTLATDKVLDQDDALMEIYRKLRPGDPPTLETAKAHFDRLFFSDERYDLSKVGRLKLNLKLEDELKEFFGEEMPPLEARVLMKEDIIAIMRYLVKLRSASKEATADDIDHLGNRRVRSVGELLENQFRIGLVRMERAIKERMSIQEMETVMPHDLINAKPVSAVVKEFFGSSQLSQFMDQTNPLSEVTHKRRLSALGPGGLTRERAGFEVRDVHPTHYGRICPIETPEGPNIGLISSLSTYAQINEFGFIETPYRKVEDSQVKDEIVYLTALAEDRYIIAQANAQLDAEGRFESELVSARKGGEPTMVAREEIQFMDVSPRQLVSVAASLIPFLENDDANRALMGSNMQRQAVPLLTTASPLVGTGMEAVAAMDSGAVVIAKRGGVVESVDADRIVIQVDEEEEDKPGVEGSSNVDIYHLIKFMRSNQNTCINQVPIVLPGQQVKGGQVIADGPATNRGELALGKNILVAFMPWHGFNFEDSILVSERLVQEDVFTSIHIEEFEVMARDTKLGKEEITRDIPNVGEEALKDLDDSGIVRIGAEVKAGDILVGKVTPKGESQLTPEEKLLRAIFGEKAGDVRDTSLRVPPGVEGVVIDVKVFSRRGMDKDNRAQAIEDDQVSRYIKDRDDEIRIVRNSMYEKIRRTILGRKLAADYSSADGKVTAKADTKVTAKFLEDLPKVKWFDLPLADPKAAERMMILKGRSEVQEEGIRRLFDGKIEKLRKGDELPPGVIKMVKVYLAIKRQLAVGDKMAGRHGNKGVLSQIVPVEDMPYMEDGTPVDMVLNPLGVPSRMNVGQILETMLGWAARGVGEKIRRVLDSVPGPDEVRDFLKRVYGADRPTEAGTRLASVIDEADDEEVMRLAQEMTQGLRVASPVFDGATEDEIRELLQVGDLPVRGQTLLFDGKTGEPFHRKVTVGYIYMMKLHHLVDDKIHARSIGPYSLVTQQPLGGKAQFGGQRFGEMEVWALEGYGAAHTLQEVLTVKSDDVAGRTKMYEAIVKGQNTMDAGLPESFNVLIKELQSFCLDVELLESEKE